MSRSTSSISCFSSLIRLESAYCINRSHLLSDARSRLVCNVVSIITFSAVIIGTVDGVWNGRTSLQDLVFQGFLASEFLFLILAARTRGDSFTAFRRLDESCGVNDKLTLWLDKEVGRQCIIGITSVFIDVIGLWFLGQNAADIFKYAVLFAAHETETVVFALIIEGMNLRLIELSSASPTVGSRVYRHVLIASNQMNEEYTLKILIMLGVTLVSTTYYACAVMLMYSEKGVMLAGYLLWRELKSMYCLWKMCRASHGSEVTCQRLAFQLADKLALHPAFRKDKQPLAYGVVRRWYAVVLRQRPRYVRGSVFSLDHSIPLHLADMTINYVLIIVQIYLAYK